MMWRCACSRLRLLSISGHSVVEDVWTCTYVGSFACSFPCSRITLSIRANHVLNLKLVQGAGSVHTSRRAACRLLCVLVCLCPLLIRSDIASDKFTFWPEYTHQFWVDERIYGYKGLQIDLFFTAGSLFTYMNLRYDEKKADADDV
jgi:hypothetical protein